MYSPKMMEYFTDPKHVGVLDKDAPDVGTGVVGSPTCGDVMQLQILVNAQSVIEDAKFKTFGCGAAISSASLAAEWLIGKSLEEAKGIKNAKIAEALELPPVKVHCSVLAEEAIQSAIDDYLSKNTAK